MAKWIGFGARPSSLPTLPGHFARFALTEPQGRLCQGNCVNWAYGIAGNQPRRTELRSSDSWSFAAECLRNVFPRFRLG